MVRPERAIEDAMIPRQWEYDEIKHICRRQLEKHTRSHDRSLDWDNAIYHFATDHLNQELSRNEIKELFQQVLQGQTGAE